MTIKIPPIAAIDIGTNSFHMVIATVNANGGLKILQREKEVVRLGSGSGDMKLLTQDAINRGVDTLQRFAQLAKSEKAIIRAIATSAVREANNKHDFINLVKKTSDIDIEVISGSEEGRLIFIGAIHALPIYNKTSLMVDIGGGSTETIIGKDGEIIFVNSEKLGAIRMTQKFFPNAESNKKSVKECREFVRGEWLPVLQQINKFNHEIIVGTSGTIQNLAIMALEKKGHKNIEFLTGITIESSEILEIIEEILNTPKMKDREKMLGMDPKRADIILGGAIILETFIKELKIEKLWISPYSLREGAVFDTFSKLKDIREFNHLTHLRFQTIKNLCEHYHLEMTHEEHVKNISLKIFDFLKDYHKLGNNERELLEAAALLHDIGYSISHDSHHKHSYYIIKNSDLPGFTNDEAEIIANIARYHRKSHPKDKHEGFANLSIEWKDKVRILSSILRIAEGLDRRRIQVVKDLNMVDNDNMIKFEILSNGTETPDLEIWGANRRKDLLESLINKTVEFV